MRNTILLSIALVLSPLTFAQPAAKQTTAQLQAAINDLHILGNDFWIYNDLAGAIAQAKQGKITRTQLVDFPGKPSTGHSPSTRRQRPKSPPPSAMTPSRTSRPHCVGTNSRALAISFLTQAA
ncbi:MAG: hypothetical protein JWN40_5571 [Phycisphaerales bacterium]|nr:hypothetical protein [Phycisphaerales bacterium]